MLNSLSGMSYSTHMLSLAYAVMLSGTYLEGAELAHAPPKLIKH